MGQKKMALINDMSGFGRCSLSVLIPIISALKIQAVAIPTAILSCHMQFPHYYIDDYTDKMDDYIQTYKDNHIEFDAIASGYLGSIKQADIVVDFIEHFKNEETIIIVDPVMGDHGKLYSTMNDSMISKMETLIQYAHIITPNLTELCALSHIPYNENLSLDDIRCMCEKLCQKGIKHIVVTGIKSNEFILNYIYNHDGSDYYIGTKKIGKDRCGAGDVMTGVIAGEYLHSQDIIKSEEKAVEFTSLCIKRCEELDIPHHYGLCIEEYLTQL